MKGCSEYRFGTNKVFDMILLAVKDNLFLNDKFDLKRVDKTFDLWRHYGIKTIKEARNFILDRKVSRIKEKAQRINNEDDREEYLTKNEFVDLQGMRDYIMKLYKDERYEALKDTIKIQYHEDILDYLPDEIEIFLKESG